MTQDSAHPLKSAASQGAPSKPIRQSAWDPSADVVRVAAVAMVVVLHVAAGLLYQFGRIPASWWWTANAIDSLMRPAVPLLVMLSGMLLLGEGKDPPLWAFARRRAERVLVPLLTWGSLYYAWSVRAGEAALSWKSVAAAFIQGPIYYHLGFLYMLLGLYLATPILRVYVQKASRSNLRYFLILWLVAASLAPTFTRFSHISIGVPFVVTTSFIGYFVLGHYLRNVKVRGPSRLATLGLFCAMAAVTAWGTFGLTSRASGTLDETLYAYLSPNVVLMAACAFLLLRSLPLAPRASRVDSWARRALRFLSRVSFGVYLIHPFVLEALGSGALGVSLTNATIHPAFGICATSMATLILSLLGVAVLRKIPVVRQLLVPE